MVLGEIEISPHNRRIGYHRGVRQLRRYPYWWYMRRYPNRIDYDVNPTNDLRRAAISVTTPAYYDKVAALR